MESKVYDYVLICRCGQKNTHKTCILIDLTSLLLLQYNSIHFGKNKLMFPTIYSTSNSPMLLTISEHFFFSLFYCPGVEHTPWGLGFLHGICMTGWVDWTHTLLSRSWLDEYCSVSPASCLFQTQHPLSVRVCIFCTALCLSLCVAVLLVCCIASLPVMGPSTSHPTVPFLPLPSFCPLLIKMF